MDTSEQPQRPRDTTIEQPAPPGAYPPPYYPSSSSPAFPFTATESSVTSSSIEPDPTQPGQARLSRPQALDLLSRLKATLVAGSVIAFGMFAALAAAHVTGVTSRSSAAQQPSNGQGTQATPTTPAADDNGGFFNQTPSSGFGIGPPSSQAPAAGTSVS